jgi:prepilin-type N-terminal cleavage/methylation domain-containing protein
MPTTSRAFTLVELVVAIAISSILIGITVSSYTLFRRSMNLDQGKSDITQNARVALDRLARELRQTPDVVTPLPADPNDNSVAQPGQIEFEDGHANDLTYRRYYISGGILKVDVKQYYFSYDTATRVKWNAIGNGGVAPVSSIVSTNDIADNALSVSFYGNNQVLILATMQDGNAQQIQVRTTILGRNL